jgi:hypothetical protein
VQKVNRGYAGFYRGYYLRSSYEYAYAKYLDFNSIPWSYEEKVFNIGFKQYKPDFFFNDVKDFRVISKAVFGEDRGRKELLKFMQNVCNEKIC